MKLGSWRGRIEADGGGDAGVKNAGAGVEVLAAPSSR
jgi:hypothetical protein